MSKELDVTDEVAAQRRLREARGEGRAEGYRAGLKRAWEVADEYVQDGEKLLRFVVGEHAADVTDDERIKALPDEAAARARRATARAIRDRIENIRNTTEPPPPKPTIPRPKRRK